MRQLQSVAPGFRANDPYWLTTADVARMLEVSTSMVRRFARTGDLAHERTISGQRIFRRDTVLRLVEARATRRLCGRPAQLQALRFRMAKAAIEPVQLLLFAGRQLRLVTGERSVPQAEPKHIDYRGKFARVR